MLKDGRRSRFVACQLIHHKTEAGNILEIVPVSGQHATGVLQCLTGEPEILNAVTMLSAGGPSLRRQAAENASCRAINRQERLSFETPERCQPPLASSCIGSNLCAEPQLRESYGRDKDGFAVGERLHISGGEPLMQDRFAVELLAAAQAMGIHTALDTNGSLGDRLTDAELEKISLVLLDIKSWDADRHRRLTGADVGPALDFARRLAIRKRPVWVRFVLVPGLTDDAENVAQIARFTAGLGNVERVDVLPFHQMGRFKWKELRLDYKLADVQPPAREAVELACARFRAEGLKAY
jgi:pyruvate-formate lyase-activating enzyme